MLLSEFKVGDRVVARGKDDGNSYTGRVSRIDLERKKLYVERGLGSAWQCRIDAKGHVCTASGVWDEVSYLQKEAGYAEDLTREVTKETKLMSVVAKFKLALTPEPEKSFIQKGIMNYRQELTADGRALFEMFMLEKHKAEFKTEVVDKIEVDERK